MPTNPHPDDPSEGSRETVERQLKRSEQKSGPDKEDSGEGADQQQTGAKEGGVGTEKAGRD